MWKRSGTPTWNLLRGQKSSRVSLEGNLQVYFFLVGGAFWVGPRAPACGFWYLERAFPLKHRRENIFKEQDVKTRNQEDTETWKKGFHFCNSFSGRGTLRRVWRIQQKKRNNSDAQQSYFCSFVMNFNDRSWTDFVPNFDRCLCLFFILKGNFKKVLRWSS